jgi:hypothetical protein
MSAVEYKVSFDEIKRSVPMEAIVGLLGLSLKRSKPTQWKGTCPFCKNKDCFVINADGGLEKTGAFNCFRCPMGGDQIELVSISRGNPRKDRKGSFEAAKELQERFLAANGETNRSLNTSPTPGPVREGLRPLEYLLASHEAVQALGVSPETCAFFGAGFANKGVMARAGGGRLAIPVHDRKGNLVAYCGRAVKEDQQPQLHFPEHFVPQDYILNAHRVVEGVLFLPMRGPWRRRVLRSLSRCADWRRCPSWGRRSRRRP